MNWSGGGGVSKEFVWARECPAGAQAPLDGTYEQCNVLGTPTGVRVTVARGEQLPSAPRGFTWRVLEPPPERSAAD